MCKKLLAMLALVIIYLNIERAFGDIIIVSSARGVMAGSTGAFPDSDSTPVAGPYAKLASSIGSGPAGIISSTASQLSSTPGPVGPVLLGAGMASVSADATGFTGFSNIAASFLDVSFDVTSTDFYDFDAEVHWGGMTPPYFGHSKIELKNLTLGTTLASILSDPLSPGTHSITSSYLLTAGTSYKLFAEVEIPGGWDISGIYSADGYWDVSLSVPEPSSLTLVGIGIGLFAKLRRWPWSS